MRVSLCLHSRRVRSQVRSLAVACSELHKQTLPPLLMCSLRFRSEVIKIVGWTSVISWGRKLSCFSIISDVRSVLFCHLVFVNGHSRPSEEIKSAAESTREEVEAKNSLQSAYTLFQMVFAQFLTVSTHDVSMCRAFNRNGNKMHCG